MNIINMIKPCTTTTKPSDVNILIIAIIIDIIIAMTNIMQLLFANVAEFLIIY